MHAIHIGVLYQALSEKVQAAESEAERLRTVMKSENINDVVKRELQFLVMTMQISLAQARADLAEVRTDLDINFKSSQLNSEGSGDFLRRKVLDSDTRIDSSPLSVTDFGDASSFSKSHRSEVSVFIFEVEEFRNSSNLFPRAAFISQPSGERRYCAIFTDTLQFWG